MKNEVKCLVIGLVLLGWAPFVLSFDEISRILSKSSGHTGLMHDMICKSYFDIPADLLPLELVVSRSQLKIPKYFLFFYQLD